MRIACNADLQICDLIFCPICCKTRGHEAYKLLLLKVFVTSSLVYLMFSDTRCKELFETISLLFFHSKDSVEDVDNNEEQANEAKEKREEKGKGKKQGDDKESEKNEKKRRNDEENRNEGEKGQ